MDEFNKLEEITRYDSYKHVISEIVFNDFCGSNIENDKENRSFEELDYNELLLIIALWVKNTNKNNTISKDSTDSLIKNTYVLLEKLHKAVFGQNLKLEADGYKHNFEELYFYSPTNAYDIQYARLLYSKYSLDKEFIKNKYGQDIENYYTYFAHIKKRIIERLNDNKTMKSISKKRKYIRLFTFEQKNDKDLFEISGFKEFLDFFSIQLNEISKDELRRISDYNPLREKPIIKIDNKYIIFSTFHLSEAMWERFFYLMNSTDYKDKALEHRGMFAEQIVYEYMKNNFKNVYQGLILEKNKKEQLTDIDVLVLHNNIAFIFMVKTKKLTLLSRQGNSDKVFEDYKKAVIDSFEQGLKAKSAILNKEVKLKEKNEELKKNLSVINEVFIFTITQDDFPNQNALSHIFLKDVDERPINSTIFDLEVILNYIETSEDFIEFTKLRNKYSEKIHLGSELGFLEFYLTHKNEDFENFDSVYLDRDWADSIDKKFYRKLLEGKSKNLLRAV